MTSLPDRVATLTVGPRLPVPRGGTALVTGASSGIGRAVAEELAQRGFRVLGTSRDPERVADPAPGVDFLPLDLADPVSVRACADRAGADGPLAVLVNNAGESQFGALEDIPEEDVERLFRVNLLGQLALTRHVLPGMRNNGVGRVVMVGSMLGSFPLAYRSTYVASKAALHGAATSIRGELAPFGVGVSTVEPGSAATGISARRTVYIPGDSAHADAARTVRRGLDDNETRGITADRAARPVLHAVTSARPHAYYAVGSGAPATTVARRLVPEQTLATLTARRHGLR